MIKIRFWVLVVVSLLFLGMAVLSCIRALSGGGGVQYFLAVSMVVGCFLFAFLAQAAQAGKWPWE